MDEFNKLPEEIEAISFQHKVEEVLSKEWNIELKERTVIIEGIKKKFDIVSNDEKFIGDVKFHKNIIKTPSGKLATVSEYVWLLQKTNAEHKFIVFGGTKDIPQKWMKRYGALIEDVKFYFFENDKLEELYS